MRLRRTGERGRAWRGDAGAGGPSRRPRSGPRRRTIVAVRTRRCGGSRRAAPGPRARVVGTRTSRRWWSRGEGDRRHARAHDARGGEGPVRVGLGHLPAPRTSERLVSDASLLRRRLDGSYTVDEWGLDADLVQLVSPAFGVRWNV